MAPTKIQGCQKSGLSTGQTSPPPSNRQLWGSGFQHLVRGDSDRSGGADIPYRILIGAPAGLDHRGLPSSRLGVKRAVGVLGHYLRQIVHQMLFFFFFFFSNHSGSSIGNGPHHENVTRVFLCGYPLVIIQHSFDPWSPGGLSGELSKNPITRRL
jgi:hypothetical protein